MIVTGANVSNSLKEAFLALFEQKHFDDISVSAICAKASASRTAFYKHFANKDELFASILFDKLIEPMQNFRRSRISDIHPDIAPSWADRIQYERVLANKDFFKKAFRECTLVTYRSLMSAYIKLNREHLSTWDLDEVESEYVAVISAAIHVSGIAKWVHDDFNISPEALAELHYKWGVKNWIEEYTNLPAFKEASTSR